MSDITYDLVIGATGSIIGAAVVYFVSVGTSLTKEARLKAEERRNLELKLWKSRKIQVRMEITNFYLFAVLKAFLLGSIFTVIPGILSFALSNLYAGRILYPVLSALMFLGLIYYFIGLGQVLGYMTIRRSDEDYLKSYVEEPVTQQRHEADRP